MAAMGRRRFAGWFQGYRSALAHRDLRLLFGGLVTSATGTWAYNVALLALEAAGLIELFASTTGHATHARLSDAGRKLGEQLETKGASA